MRRMWDAAFPPANPPKWEVAAGYIGGNTPHVWTDAEWAATKTRWRLPIFTRSHDGDPKADAAFSVAWLGRHNVPKGVTLALDYETRVDATYLKVFDQVVVAAGYRTMVYGTRRTVLQNPKPSGGYWDAQWTNEPHLNAGSAATQYGSDVALGQPYDASLVADATPLWDTRQEETFMTLTVEQEQKLVRAADQILGAVAQGQTSFSETIEATLSAVQGLTNLVKGGQGALAGSIADVRSAVLGAVAALPAPETPEQAMAAKDQILQALSAVGVEGVSADAILDALHARLAA